MSPITTNCLPISSWWGRLRQNNLNSGRNKKRAWRRGPRKPELLDNSHVKNAVKWGKQITAVHKRRRARMLRRMQSMYSPDGRRTCHCDCDSWRTCHWDCATRKRLLLGARQRKLPWLERHTFHRNVHRTCSEEPWWKTKRCMHTLTKFTSRCEAVENGQCDQSFSQNLWIVARCLVVPTERHATQNTSYECVKAYWQSKLHTVCFQVKEVKVHA